MFPFWLIFFKTLSKQSSIAYLKPMNIFWVREEDQEPHENREEKFWIDLTHVCDYLLDSKI